MKAARVVFDVESVLLQLEGTSFVRWPARAEHWTRSDRLHGAHVQEMYRHAIDSLAAARMCSSRCFSQQQTLPCGARDDRVAGRRRRAGGGRTAGRECRR